MQSVCYTVHMKEYLNPDSYPVLRHEENWQNCFSDPEFQNAFNNLLELTRNHTAEDLDWISDPNELTERWQRCLETIIFIHGIGDAGLGYDDEAPTIEAGIYKSVAVVTEAIQTEGWTTPGLGFRIISRGYRWVVDEKKIPAEHMYSAVDLRDMERPVTLLPLDVYEFVQLSDAETELVKERV